MATFTPPVTQEIPNVTVDTPQLVKDCMRHFSRPDQAENVWIVDNTTVQTYAPIAVYDSEGKITTWPEDRVTRFFQGGAIYEVNAYEQSLLEDAGYTIV